MSGTGVTFAFDADAYPLARLAAEALGLTSWDELPQGDPREPQSAAQINAGFRRAGAGIPVESPFIMAFRDFGFEVLMPSVGVPISFTQRPVLRVQIGHSPSISAPHRDVEYTGRFDYVNGWMPLTPTSLATSLRIETDYGSGIYAPRLVPFGEFLLFDGGLLEHWSGENTTPVPRVSIDFRFVLKADCSLRRRLLGSRPVHAIERSQRVFLDNKQAGRDSETKRTRGRVD